MKMASSLSCSSSSESHGGAGRNRMVTRALIKGRSPSGKPDGPVGGVLHCVCTAYLLSKQETLLECQRCKNWCHPACVGVDHTELRRHQVENTYVCPFCSGVRKRQRSVAQAPTPRQPPLRLREVRDKLPFGSVMQLRHYLKVTKQAATRAGFVVIDLPLTKLTDAMEKQCLECCKEAIKEATFSEQYPSYCLKEIREEVHPYVQGSLLRCVKSDRIVSMVLSNGMDVYGNLRPTVTQLKSGINRGIIDRKHQTAFMAACTELNDVSDFVHITLSATHRDYQGRGLARMLMVIDLLKWALRGRTRAYLNMALEKKVVNGGTRLECVASPASRRLYESFGFKDVYPRFDRDTDEQRWTPKEADMGRVMAHLSFVGDVVKIAARYNSDVIKPSSSAIDAITSSRSSSSSMGGAAGVQCSDTRSTSPPKIKKRLSLLGRKS